LILEETYTVSNGVAIPKLGLGTWFIDNDSTAEAIREAASIGYRHVDTAQVYGNEAGVGETASWRTSRSRRQTTTDKSSPGPSTSRTTITQRSGDKNRRDEFRQRRRGVVLSNQRGIMICTGPCRVGAR
jgi:hypothetical protein